MPHGHDSLADYYRAHREEMELALASGCTPLEARRELRRRAKARRAACGTRAIEAEQTTSNAMSIPQSGHDIWDAPWMMRD